MSFRVKNFFSQNTRMKRNKRSEPTTINEERKKNKKNTRVIVNSRLHPIWVRLTANVSGSENEGTKTIFMFVNQQIMLKYKIYNDEKSTRTSSTRSNNTCVQIDWFWNDFHWLVMIWTGGVSWTSFHDSICFYDSISFRFLQSKAAKAKHCCFFVVVIPMHRLNREEEKKNEADVKKYTKEENAMHCEWFFLWFSAELLATRNECC